MPKRIIFKLMKDAQGNHLPMVGVVSAAYYNHSEVAKKEGWAAQLKLIGTWEIDGRHKDGDIYLPLGILGDMVAQGFIHAEAVEGEPDKYRIMMPNTRVQLLKEKGDGDREYIHFSIVGQQPAENAPQAPQDRPESTKSPDEDIHKEKAAAPSQRDMMAEIETKYAACLAMSAYRHVTLYAIPTYNLDQRSVQAGAATMMIEMSRHGIKPTPAMLKALMERLKDASLTATVEDPVEAM